MKEQPVPASAPGPIPPEPAPASVPGPGDIVVEGATGSGAVERALGGRQSESGRPTEAPPEPPDGWRAGERALRYGTVAALALGAALVTGRPWLLALAAGPLVLLALALPRTPRARHLTATVEVAVRRCFEGEQVVARIAVVHDGGEGRLDPGVMLGPGCGWTR